MIRTLEKIMGQPLPRQTLTDFDYSIPMRDTTPAAHKPACARVDARRALAARGVKLMDHPTQTARPAQRIR